MQCYAAIFDWKKYRLTLAGWLSWLEPCSVHQKCCRLDSWSRHISGCRFDPWSRLIFGDNRLIFLSHIDVSLFPFPSLFPTSSISKINLKKQQSYFWVRIKKKSRLKSLITQKVNRQVSGESTMNKHTDTSGKMCVQIKCTM